MKIISIIDRLLDFFQVKTGVELANKLGVTPTTISNWKKRNTIDFELLFTKCEGVNYNWLFMGVGNKFYSEDLPPDNHECLLCKEKDKRIESLQKIIQTQSEYIELLKEASPEADSGQKRKAV